MFESSEAIFITIFKFSFYFSYLIFFLGGKSPPKKHMYFEYQIKFMKCIKAKPSN